MVSLYGEPLQKYDDNFELYLDPAAEHQIELRLKISHHPLPVIST